jgi:hypothetical protein
VPEVTSDSRRALLAGADEMTVADLARRHGYLPLREAGLVLANHGKTTFEPLTASPEDDEIVEPYTGTTKPPTASAMP